MAININDQFNVNAGKSVDSKYGKTVAGKTVPFVSTTEANAAINIAYRYEGLTVVIDSGSGPVEYWYTSDLSDGNLVTKTSGASLPTLATVATTGSYTDLINKPTLAAVATSGSYTDLANKPSIPSITFDSTPTTGSSNAVTSTGIKSYVDGKVPAFYTIEGSLASPYLLTYSLSIGYMNRYKNVNPVTTGYGSMKLGDIICNTDASGNVLGIY